MRLYATFAEWWPLVSPPEEYAEEAAFFADVLRRACDAPPRTLLELGSGGGHTASHLGRLLAAGVRAPACRLTLTDLEPRMLDLSRRLNPEAEHLAGDMRTLRLLDGHGVPRLFDAVLVHDAVMYMTSEADLLRTVETAFAHCRPGGAALFVPDCVRETFAECTTQVGGDGTDGRAVRLIDWSHDPDPSDDEFASEMVLMLREPGGAVRVDHERHRFGLFASATWLLLLERAGFRAAVLSCPHPGAERARCFVGRRPAAASSRRADDPSVLDSLPS